MLLAKVIGVGELSVIWVSLNDQLRPAASRVGHREVWKLIFSRHALSLFNCDWLEHY
jgi:hypothetical protein